MQNLSFEFDPNFNNVSIVIPLAKGHIKFINLMWPNTEILQVPSWVFSRLLEYQVSSSLLWHQVSFQRPEDPYRPVILEQDLLPVNRSKLYYKNIQ